MEAKDDAVVSIRKVVLVPEFYGMVLEVIEHFREGALPPTVYGDTMHWLELAILLVLGREVVASRQLGLTAKIMVPKAQKVIRMLLFLLYLRTHSRCF